MAVSNEIRKLSVKWATGSGWPKRLDFLKLEGLRGWTGQEFQLRYPIMAVTGENGVGKSSILQAAASIYRPSSKFASDFFPDTAWETITDAVISYQVREGTTVHNKTLRKPGERWRGNPDRRERPVAYIDLNRIQPVSARPGYTRLVKSQHKEISANLFDADRLQSFSQVMGRSYDVARMALTDADARRRVPVLSQHGTEYSGFHQGAGETTVADLMEVDAPKYCLVLIDEIESSLHPRAQRRLVRYLAEKCREREWQVIISTHSPYILAELPPDARAYIMQVEGVREIVYGVSPEFAMSRMDDVVQPECDLYVEDVKSKAMLSELYVRHNPDKIVRCRIVAYGAASVGQALGQMVAGDRFPRPALVFLDGDQPESVGCINLPGGDAPERVVFGKLETANWGKLHERVGRPFAKVADCCSKAMLITDHHDWVQDAANGLLVGGDILWQGMCAEWASMLSASDVKNLCQYLDDALEGQPFIGSVVAPQLKPNIVPPKPKPAKKTAVASAQQLLFSQSGDVPQE
jgi:predicted ATPase